MTSQAFFPRAARTALVAFASLGLAAATLAWTAAPASAQIAAALGRPLPVSADPTGSVSVRVVAGDPTIPAAGLDVTLMVGATPRVARTAADGRATFTNIPAGAQAMIKVPGKDGGEQSSQPFTMPGSGGVRLLMSTTGGFSGSGGGGGAAAPADGGGMAGTGGGAAPSLRQRSGGVIANPGTAANSLSLRLSYDDPADPAPPKDQSVALVGYDSSEKITLVRKQSDEQGRITFDGLDVSGATAYFVMTLLPRGNVVERLLSGPIIPPGGTGLAMVLSAEKRDSSAPAVDDLWTIQSYQGTVPAGQVLVEIQGQAEPGKITLHDVENGAELSAGEIVAPAENAAPDQPNFARATIDVTAQPPGRIVYAESKLMGQRYRSLPFQLVPDRGARVTLLAVPRVMMRFSLTSALDEDYFIFRGRFLVGNNSWFPYKHSEDGFTMPLPKGFSGAQVTEEDAAEISPVPGSGLRLLRPVPPGGKQFIAGWSMNAKGGEITWDLELPFDLIESGMELIQPPGAQVELPPGAQGRSQPTPRGTYFILPDISIRANQRMVMRIHGLPSAPAWKVWAPRAAGALVLLILLGGLAYAFRGRPAGEGDDEHAVRAANQRQIDALMDELVALEGSDDEERRAEIMAELEKLWPTATAQADKASA
jgi:hypothetical protein